MTRAVTIVPRYKIPGKADAVHYTACTSTNRFRVFCAQLNNVSGRSPIALINDPRRLRRWLRKMEMDMAAAPTLFQAKRMKAGELRRRLHEHSVSARALVSVVVYISISDYTHTHTNTHRFV